MEAETDFQAPNVYSEKTRTRNNFKYLKTEVIILVCLWTVRPTSRRNAPVTTQSDPTSKSLPAGYVTRYKATAGNVSIEESAQLNSCLFPTVGSAKFTVTASKEQIIYLAGRSWVPDQMWSLNFFSLPNPSSRTSCLGLLNL
jgi:hypothetical protein